VLGWSSFSGDYAAPIPGVLNARHWRYTISGRAAIVLALRVLGVQPGDKVLVPTYHCPTMIAPVVQAGARPMFYPITASGAPDLEWLARADLVGARVILVTHYFGLPQPMAVVRSFCVALGCHLIEDCAHAFFGITDDWPVGSWGDVSIASLTKFFPVPEGGLIASATRPLKALDLEPRGWYGEIKAASDAIELGVEHEGFPGLNSLFAGVFAMKNRLRHGARGGLPDGNGDRDPAVTRVVERLLSSSRPAMAVRWIANTVHRSRIVELRRRNYAELARRLSGLAGARPLQAQLPDGAAPYVFPLYVDDPTCYQRLRATGIPIFRWDEVWPGTPHIEGDHGLDWSTHVFQLGCHQDLSVENVDAIVTNVRTVIQDTPPRSTPRPSVAPTILNSTQTGSSMMKRILMIAFHFPPLAGSSGIQRTLRFARHLPQFGWEPLVLTADPRAYERVSDDQVDEVRAGSIVERAFALDSARHLAISGRYPAFFARPDRWVTWWLGAIPRGLAMIRKYRPQVIWSTYPIATAHRIGRTLNRLSGVPWVADFRDPMAQEGYPRDPKTWQSFKRIEQDALHMAVSSVFVTPGAARLYRSRYPDVPDERIAVIENGYDEESFHLLDGSIEAAGPLIPGPLTLVHSGVVYPSERDPTHFFHALRRMLDEGALHPGELRVRLRASAHEGLLAQLIDRYAVADVVELAPPITYKEALKEMMRADGLLVLQASNCNEQIPAKAYEYLRCGRPIIGLTDPAGDTANMLRQAGVRNIAPLDSAEEIAREMRRFLGELQRGEPALPTAAYVTGSSRLQRTRELADLLDRLPLPQRNH
jgi:dTDP-4-amino-4,6-dideoxygalactose transaminase/glycosyltransferase involved in cell wall biosynthesis